MEAIYIDEDNVIQWDGMADSTDSTYINDATATYAIKTLGGTSKATGSLAYVSGSDGKYQGTLDKADACLLYTSPSPRDLSTSRMPSSA